jgi:mitochondrial fission protein ELM1
VASYRAGESSQITGLASRLGWPVTVKRLRYNKLAGPIGLGRQVSVRGIDVASQAQLAAPWPQILISAGVKNEPVARWIKAQSAGRTRLVFLGRTWAPRPVFDLVITTPQYRLPEAPNVVQNLMTQHGLTAERLAAARAQWAARLGEFPAPRTGVLVGGNSGPFAFGERAAARLVEALNARLDTQGGSVLVTTSARTPTAAADVLETRLRSPSLVYRWKPDDAENPYSGILAFADRLVVTSDSIAMLSEAAATGNPVEIFDLGAAPVDATFKSLCYRTMMRVGPARASRDLGLFHRAFVDAGHGSWMGAVGVGSAEGDAVGEVERTVGRVTELL